MEEVVAREMAEKEFDSWLECKGIRGDHAEAMKNVYGQVVIDYICEGKLILDPTTKVITQKLTFPFGKDPFVTKELKYQPRVTVAKMRESMRGVADNDNLGKTIARLAAMSDTPVSEIGLMDTEDIRVASFLAVFFQT